MGRDSRLLNKELLRHPENGPHLGRTHIRSHIIPSRAPSPDMQFFLINAFDCLALSFFLFLLVKFRDNRRRRGLPYPPGPPSWPIMGNFLDVPALKPWITYTDMSKKYGRCNIHSQGCRFAQLILAFQGDVSCLRVFSQVIVVLSSLSTVKDLLEMRGEYYSERPHRPMVEMCVLYRISFSICRHVDNPRSPGQN